MATKQETVEIKIEVEGEKQAGKALRSLSGSTQSMTGSFIKADLAVSSIKSSLRLATDIIQGAARATQKFAVDSIDSYRRSEQAMTSLKILAPRFGVAFEDAQKSAKKLGEELRIGITPAADALQTLLSDGLGLEQAEDLLRRFANEAIIGKVPTIDMATAVSNLALAYKRKSSILGDASGITENFSDIIKEGEESLIKKGIAVKDITEDMAKYEGIILLTNKTEGAFAALSDSTAAKQDALRQRFVAIKVTVGEMLDGALGDLIDYFNNTGALEKFEIALGGVVAKLTEWWQLNKGDVFESIDKVVQKVKEWWKLNKDDLIQSIGDLIEKIKGYDWKALAEDIGIIAGVVVDLATAAKDAAGFVKELGNLLGIDYTDIFPLLKSAEGAVVLIGKASDVKDGFDDITKSVGLTGDTSNETWKLMSSDFDALGEEIKKGHKDIQDDSNETWGAISDTWDDTVSWFDRNVKDQLVAAGTFVQEKWDDSWEILDRNLRAVWDGMTSWFSENVTPQLSTAAIFIQEKWEDSGEILDRNFRAVWDGMTSWFDENVTPQLSAAAVFVQEKWDDSGEILKKNFIAALEAMLFKMGENAALFVAGWMDIRDQASAAADFVTERWNNAGTILDKNFRALWTAIVEWYEPNIRDQLAAAGTWVKDKWDDSGEILDRNFRALWGAIIEWYNPNVRDQLVAAGTHVQEKWKASGEILDRNFRAVWNGISTWFSTTITPQLVAAYEGARTKFESSDEILIKNLKAAWGTVSTWFQINVIDQLVASYGGMETKFKGSDGVIVRNFMAVWTPMAEWFRINVSDQFVAVWEEAMMRLPNFGEILTRNVKAGINELLWLVEQGLNKMREGWNSIARDIPGLDTIEYISVPRLAKGTRNFQGGMAVVGEEGPELVSMPRGSRVFTNKQSEGMINNNNNQKNVNVNIGSMGGGNRGMAQNTDILSQLLLNAI